MTSGWANTERKGYIFDHFNIIKKIKEGKKRQKQREEKDKKKKTRTYFCENIQ
jgi:hypothetical protein